MFRFNLNFDFFFCLKPLRRASARKLQPLQFVFDSFDKQNPDQPPMPVSPQLLGYRKKIRCQPKAELERWSPMQETPPTFVHLLPMFVFFSRKFLLIFFSFSRRPDLLFDKTSSSSADLHELGDDSTNSHFLLQSETDHRQSQQLMQFYLYE
jgi:hypothetical protein